MNKSIGLILGLFFGLLVVLWGNTSIAQTSLYWYEEGQKRSIFSVKNHPSLYQLQGRLGYWTVKKRIIVDLWEGKTLAALQKNYPLLVVRSLSEKENIFLMEWSSLENGLEEIIMANRLCENERDIVETAYPDWILVNP